MTDHEPDPEDGPDYHADHMAWATRTTTRLTADRIGLEVERDAALAEVVRLRKERDEAIDDLHLSHGFTWQDECERLQAIIAEAAAIHVDAGDSQGFTAAGYRVIDSCCGECGTHGEYGHEWPCDTAKALAKATPE